MEDNLDYLVSGYAVGYLILFISVASIWWRYRGLAADESALEQLKTDIENDQ